MYPHDFDNAGSYRSDHSAVFASGGLPNGYPSMIPPPSIGQFDTQTHNTFADHWGMMASQRYPTVGGSLGVPGTPSFQPVTEATPCVNDPVGYNQPSLPNYHWPAVNQQPQPQHPRSLGWNTLAAGNAMMPEVSTSLPAPSTAPFHYWGNNQNGPITAATFDLVRAYHGSHQPRWRGDGPSLDAYTLNQPASGPSRIGHPASSRRFQPYGASRARRVTEHQNAEAGSSTLMSSQAQNVGLPTSKPPGGLIPETTADAETTKPNTEEAEAPVQEKVRCPRGQGKLRPGRIGVQGNKGKLCGLIKKWKSLKAEPSTAVALTATVQYISTVREEVYEEPRLEEGVTKPCPAEGRKKREWERRREERELLGRLSQFYELPADGLSGGGKKGREQKWTAPALWREVLKDMEVRYPPLGSPSPQPSTSTAAGSLLG